MPVGSDVYACEFRIFDFHERRVAPEDAPQQERERCEKDNDFRTVYDLPPRH